MSSKGDDKCILSVHNLNKSFGTNQVLNGFEMELHKGESLVILGKSGSGKSVLIKCIIGLMQPDSGEIMVLGKKISLLSSSELNALRMRVGFLFQSNALYDSMTVRENLQFPLRRHWYKKSREEVNELVIESLNAVGLKNTIDMMPAELSGGMRKRIALARTLILKPEIILYDEPTTGLDPVTGRGIGNLMVDIQKKYDTSSIIISHDMNCVKTTSNRIILLREGQAYASGTYNDFINSNDPKINEFFS